jgi:hypothetical protein
MKTPAQLLDDATRALNQMDDHIRAVFDYASLLGVLLAGSDAETAIDGMHRLMLEIRASADDLRTFHDDATQAVKRLAKP